MVLDAPRRASVFVESEDRRVLKDEPDARVQRFRNEILVAASTWPWGHRGLDVVTEREACPWVSTYVWIVSNRKPAERKGKLQLIEASVYWQKMRKSLGRFELAFVALDLDGAASSCRASP